MKIGTVGNILVTVKEIELIEPYLSCNNRRTVFMHVL
jgi:hypothetical protein